MVLMGNNAGGTAVASLLRMPVHSGCLRFVSAFSISCITLYALIFLLSEPLMLINEHTAQTLGNVLYVIGIPVSVAGDLVSGKGFAVRIIPECTALLMAGLFACFVLFYPATARQKAAGLAMGLPALYLGNLARLTAIFFVCTYDKRLFNIIHTLLGQVFTVTFVLVMCILWLKSIATGRSSKDTIIRISGYLARLVVIAGCLFLLWIEVNDDYIRFVDQFLVLGFSLFDYRLVIPRDTVIYYETFNIVTFTALLLATRSVAWSKKVNGLAAGLTLFFSIHLFHRFNNTLMSAFQYTAFIKLDYVLCAVGQYLLPALLWFLITIGRLPHLKKPKVYNIKLET
ncbi:MAG: Transmembrane exosortase (Exosortase_EpsH) [Syntrophorhabdus sp. PtaU1.Bin058]|nr:MAG: Transmembrane exosortase (Exosortase_EpsH) [Syntrophorhabdus sp. PtaU1.Bin058]